MRLFAIIIMVLSLEGTALIAPNANAQDNKNKIFEVSPNPAKSQIVIRGDLANGKKGTIAFYNTIGIEVLKLSTSDATGYFIEKIDISNLPKGIYLIRLESGEQINTIRFIKQ